MPEFKNCGNIKLEIDFLRKVKNNISKNEKFIKQYILLKKMRIEIANVDFSTFSLFLNNFSTKSENFNFNCVQNCCFFDERIYFFKDNSKIQPEIIIKNKKQASCFFCR